MSTINRSDFQRQFQNQSLNLERVDEATQQKLEQAGSSRAAVAQADLNGDGKIQGTRELNALFRHMDSFDRNGSGRSFIAQNQQTGQATNSGKVYSALSLLFQETGGVDTVARDNNLRELGQQFAAGGAQSIADKMGAHLENIEQSGVGIYYGDHSSLKGKTLSEKQEWIDNNATEGTNPPSASQLKESSCIGWAMENVEAAYIQAGKAERWSEIKSIVYSKGTKGTDLAQELQKDGWEAVYWNPDARNPDDGNAEHSYTAAITKRGKPYYGINVDHRVVDYRPTSGGSTELDMSGVEKLREVPFFFGLAKGGMHTFVGREGKVNEFHWTAKPDDDNAIEERPLEDFPWNSGVIMIPPGTWPN
ncbi:MAG: hypothetical protein EP343_23880 [Deltaproteobacteria bacterium]|nr:MAG: hypothetical protein EP343_23880 [Deltaproteobacteria bacterium]